MKSPRVLALLPFLVKGALSLEIFRAARLAGSEIDLAFCADASDIYECDAMADFASTGHLHDLSALSSTERLGAVDELVRDRGIALLLQVGADELYHQLPYWKERHPRLRIADILYNEFGHTLNHFLYEGCIDAVIVESAFMRDFVAKASGLADRRVEVLHSGVDLQAFDPAPPRPAAAPLRLGYVGRMSVEKNPVGFIELAEKLGAHHPSIVFEMFGGGGDAQAVRERVAKSALAGRLRYHGFVEHQRDALRQIDVLVLPSHFDGRPVVVMEANACGVPVIAAPVGGLPEMIVEGRNGFLLRPTDVDGLHALVSGWQDDPDSLAALKLAARRHAEECFGRQRMIDAYVAAFARIAPC